jgi:hypothetical protein
VCSSDLFLREGTLGRFLGMEWVAYDHTYLVKGSPTRYIDDDTVVFVPAPDGDWGHFDVGSDVVPSDDKRSMQEVVGRYAYSNVGINPASMEIYAGEVRLPIIRIPSALGVLTALH